MKKYTMEEIRKHVEKRGYYRGYVLICSVIEGDEHTSCYTPEEALEILNADNYYHTYLAF